MARRRTAAAKPVLARLVQATPRAALIASVSLISLAAAGVLGTRGAAAQEAAQTLPGTQILPGGRWAGARLPSVAQGNNGLVMTIKQEQKAALLDWSRFDVGASEEVHFEQGGADWIALNRIFSADPSQIAGKITARGQVWLANTNGVVFKGTARVNTASMLVTTAVMPDSILDPGGLLDSRSRPGGGWGNIQGLLVGAKGDIVVESGAKLTFKSADPTVASSAVFLGVNVINNGTIDVTDGTVVMLAGEDFSLVQNRTGENYNYDFLRGFYGLSSARQVEFGRWNNEARWDAAMYERAAEVGMRVVNNGVINATRSTVLLQGADIQQNGTISATSGVRQRTGSILLRAGFGFDDSALVYSGHFDYLGGDVTFGEGSLTQVTPETGTDSSPALETFTGVNRPRISVVGRDVLMEQNSTLRANGGLITIDGNYSAEMAGDFSGADRGKPGSFVMKSGALIDVSGIEGVKRDVADNIVDLEIRANELAGSPVQRDGILYGEDVKIDIRNGSSIVDWTGAQANRNLTAEDRSINGGEVQIRALSTVQVENGAKIDISGGSAEYSGGWIDVTQLTGADGKVVDIAKADANVKYTGLSTSKRYEAGYIEGGDAGRLEILSSSQKLFGRVVSDTIVGQRQAAAGVTGSKPAVPSGSIDTPVSTRLPKGGTVILGTPSESLNEYFFDQVFVTKDQGPVTLMVNGREVTLDPSKLGLDGKLADGYTQAQVGSNNDPVFHLLAPGWVMHNDQPVELRQALIAEGYQGDALEALLQPGAALPAGFQRGREVAFSFIDDDFAAGAQTLSFQNKVDATSYNFSVMDGVQLRVAAGGSLILGATPAKIGRDVLLSAAGGNISIVGKSIGDGTVISVAGQWTNDLDGAGRWGGYVNGGTITLGGVEGDSAVLEGDVTFDASGGGWWKRLSPASQAGPGSFELVNGKGGKIDITRALSQTGAELLERADFKLGGLGGAGGLTLSGMDDVVVGPDGGKAPDGALYLSNATLNGWGLGSLAINGGFRQVPLGEGVIGRVTTDGVRNPNTTSQDGPDAYLVAPGQVITAELYQGILAANLVAEAYNANLPDGGARRSQVSAVLIGADIDIRGGTRLDLVQQVLVLDRPAGEIATDADLSLVTTAIVPPAHLRNGVTFGLSALGNLTLDEAASIKVATNGAISLSGANVDVAGDLTALSGAIGVSSSSAGALRIRSTAFLDARGEVVTRPVPGAAPGDSWIAGNVYSGGDITVGGGYVLVEKGARLDVSGVAGMLTVTVPSRLTAVRVDRLIGGDAGTITVGGASGYLLGDLRGTAGVGFNGIAGRNGVLNLSGGANGEAPSAAMVGTIIDNIINNGIDTYGFDNFADLAEAFFGAAPGTVEPIPISDTVALRAFLTAAFAEAANTDPSGYLALDPTLDAPGAPPPPPTSYQPSIPAGYELQAGGAAYATALAMMIDYFSGANYAQTFGRIRPGTTFHIGQAPLAAAAGFDDVKIDGAVRVDSDMTLKALRSLSISSMWAPDADVTLQAPIINFTGGAAGTAVPTGPGVATGGEFKALAETINVASARFDGFSKVTLEARRSLSGGSKIFPDGAGGKVFSSVYAPGELIIRAGQVYPYTGMALGIFSDTSITFQKTGLRGAAPLSAGGKLVIEAPTINQGGVLAAPFGTIEFEGENVNFLPGSLTTVSADGRTILYGHTIDGSNWYGPTPDSQEDVLLSTPPEKRIVVSGDNVDLQAGAVIDASGGGDVLGLEFVQGPKGANNILTGDGVFAISPAFGADASLGQAPTDKPRDQLAVGDVVWLPAFDGNPAGYYTLLPAEYALTPGAYRVTLAAGAGGSTSPRKTGDGSFMLTGSQAGEQGVAFANQSFLTFQVMSGAGVRDRSEFIETSGNGFFSSERFLVGLERSGGVFNADPRLPVDGGFMTIAARESLQLNGTFSAEGATASDRGGLLDIAGDRIVVASAGTDVSDLVGYLRLDPTQLSGVAESLLIGGVRRQGAGGLEIVAGYESRDDTGAPVGGTVGAESIIVRNGEGDALTGTEILFAATGEIRFESGSVVRAVGDGAQAEDIIIRPELAQHTVEWPPAIYEAEDRGAFVRVSNLGDVGITRTNAKTDRGDVVLESGARLEATDAVAVNATRNTTLEPGAILKAGVVEAAAGRVSFGDAPAIEDGLVLNDAAFTALASAQTLRLRSFTTFDIYGDVNLSTVNNLVLDGGGFVNVDGQSSSTFSAKTLTLSNTDAPGYTPTAVGGSLKLNAETLVFGEGALGIDFADVDIDAKGRVLFTGVGKVLLPGSVTIKATEVGAASGASHGLDAAGAVVVAAQAAPLTLAKLETAGATLDLKGQSVSVDLPVTLSSGVFRATATTGDVTVGSKARIDVSGSAIKFYEVTEYLGAGGIGLTSESGDVTLASGAVLDLSGGATGDAGDLIISAGRGIAVLDGELKAQPGKNGKGGAFTLQTSTLADFAALNNKLNTSGFSRSRRFAVVSGDVNLTGETRVDEFELSTGQGSITIDGGAKVITTRAKGGKIVIASGGDLVVEDGALLDASAKGTGDQRGGLVSLQVGDNGSLDVGAATLRVSGKGKGEAGEVKLRARQIGGDVAVDRYTAIVQGGATTLEAYKVTDLGAGDNVIDTALQTDVVAQAAAFMAGGNVSAIRTRLGQSDTTAFQITPGIEIRSGGDLTLVDDWNLAPSRFGGQPGALTLRAGGDLKLDANLSDGFLSAQQGGPRSPSDPASALTPLTNDQSWSYNLVAGADFSQTNVLATRASATGEGDVLINAIVRTGTGDINVAASGDLNYKPTRDYQFDIRQGVDGSVNVAIIYPDGTLHNYTAVLLDDGRTYEAVAPELGKIRFGEYFAYRDAVSIEAGNRVIQGDYDNDGSRAAFTVQYVDGAMYTAGREAAPLANFDSPTQYYGGSQWDPLTLSHRPASFLEKGGDITVAVGGDINGAGDAILDATWYGKRGRIEQVDVTGPLDAPFTTDRGGIYQQTALWVTPDSFRQSLGALGGGDVTIRAGGTVDNLAVAMPTTTRVGGGRTVGEAKVLDIRGGGDLEMTIGGDLLGGSIWVGKGSATIEVDGRMDKTADADIENPFLYQSNIGGYRPDRRQQGHIALILDDADMRITTGGDARFASVRSSSNKDWHYEGFSWLSYTERTRLDVISSGGDVQFYAAGGDQYDPGDILPSKTRLVSISGSVMIGDWNERSYRILIDSFPDGQFDILARKDIGFWNIYNGGQSQTFNGGYGQRGYDAPGFALSWGNSADAPRALNPFQNGSLRFSQTWGGGGPGYGRMEGADSPNEGLDTYARIYTLDGDIYQATNTPEDPFYAGDVRGWGQGNFIFGYETRIKAGDDIRMGIMEFLNHDPDDVSIVQAGGSIYLPDVTVYGEGRMWVQAGNEIYMGTTPGVGIRAAEDYDYAQHIEDNGADVSVLAGIDQDPNYEPFFDYYLGGGDLSAKPIYLSEFYTFDAIGLGTPHPTVLADGQTEVTIYAVDLVNYWNEMNGRPPLSLEDDKGKPIPRGQLVSKISKEDYDAANAWLADLDPSKKQGLATRIMFAEIKTAGREAVASSAGTDPSQTRAGDPSRGYAAIGKLFPGAQRKPGEAKTEGESRWFGDIIMTNSQIRTDGGGNIEMLAPGGLIQLASLSVANTDPNTSGVLSQDRGDVNVLTYGDYIVNQSRTMTADDGDILIWSSFGNIDAGKGRKTSLSIPPIVFPVDSNAIMRIIRSGLPNGAGIATLNRVDGTPGGDVDLYAFNGIVNAGDAGIRASRDLFVGALEIRGLDNITVGGLTNVELNTEEAELGAINLENFAQAAEDEALAQAFDMSAEVEKLRTVTQTILTGSVVSFGEEPEDRKKKD